jgi:plasmid maintenance system antidote protein VapI
MTLTDYIEAGAQKATTVAELARIIGTTREHASAAKSLKKPLPLDSAIKLADYIGADRIAVISANELATEKKEEKRAFWSHLLAAPQTSYIRQMMN